jgi:transposase
MRVMAAARKYSDELRERAIRLDLEARQDPRRAGAVRRIGEQLDINPETLRSWMKRVDIDAGVAPGLSTADAQRISNGRSGSCVGQKRS